MEKILKIGIMGGTFDPVHYGHVISARKVKAKLNLDEVVFVPSGRPPHKKGRLITDGSHRLNMVELAIRDEEGVSCSDMELKRPGYSYAIDTVNAFYDMYGQDIDLWFITGSDAIEAVSSWYRAEELFARCRFVDAVRAGTKPHNPDKIPKACRDRVLVSYDSVPPISSSDIRQRIREGKSIAELVPPAVEEYIKVHGLYR